MPSRLISSIVRCSIPRVSFIYRSRFYSTTPLISRGLILRNLISKPCCAVSFKSASSTSLASENDKIKRADEDLLRALESEIAEKELQEKVLPKDFQFETIDNHEDCLKTGFNSKNESITLKREYGGEQIQAIATIYPGLDDQGLETRISVIYLKVTIEKNVGPTLKFSGWLRPNDFKIGSMSLGSSKNSNKACFQRLEFIDLDTLDKRLHKAFDEYLAARGFTTSLFDYLRDHKSRKDKEYPAWLKSLKDFIEN